MFTFKMELFTIWICLSALINSMNAVSFDNEWYDKTSELSYDFDTEQSKDRYDINLLSKEIQKRPPSSSSSSAVHRHGAVSCYTDDNIKYKHGEKVIRLDPCEICLCMDGEIFCWWKKCGHRKLNKKVMLNRKQKKFLHDIKKPKNLNKSKHRKRYEQTIKKSLNLSHQYYPLLSSGLSSSSSSSLSSVIVHPNNLHNNLNEIKNNDITKKSETNYHQALSSPSSSSSILKSKLSTRNDKNNNSNNNNDNNDRKNWKNILEMLSTVAPSSEEIYQNEKEPLSLIIDDNIRNTKQQQILKFQNENEKNENLLIKNIKNFNRMHYNFNIKNANNNMPSTLNRNSNENDNNNKKMKNRNNEDSINNDNDDNEDDDGDDDNDDDDDDDDGDNINSENDDNIHNDDNGKFPLNIQQKQHTVIMNNKNDKNKLLDASISKHYIITSSGNIENSDVLGNDDILSQYQNSYNNDNNNNNGKNDFLLNDHLHYQNDQSKFFTSASSSSFSSSFSLPSEIVQRNKVTTTTAPVATVATSAIETAIATAAAAGISAVSNQNQFDQSCIVMGKSYKIGTILPQETGNCLQCICIEGANKGEPPRVTCSPHNCPPLILPDLFDTTGY